MSNPLETYFRQPAIYITLPSKGEYYPPDTLTLNENKEIAVYPMTAKDEIVMKTPDALLTGQSTVDVIQSCIPAIKDAWKIPSIDIDTILIAIRIATYGEEMPVSIPITEIKESLSASVNLTNALERVNSHVPNTELILPSGIKVKIKPIDYAMMSRQAMRVYDEQRMVKTVQDSELDDETKTKKYMEVFTKVAMYSVDEMISSIDTLHTPDGKQVTEQGYITEFVQNMDVSTSKLIKQKIDEIRKTGAIPPMEYDVPEDMVEKGAPKTISVPMTFDTSVFFG